MMPSFNAVNTLALGDVGKSFIASAYAFTAPAFVTMPAASRERSPNAFIGANGSVSPPNRLIMPSFNAINTLALGLLGKSFIASAYDFTALAFAIIPLVLNDISPKALIGAIGSVLPPSRLIMPSFNAINTLALGLLGKSFIASA